MKKILGIVNTILFCLISLSAWSGDGPCTATVLSTNSSEFLVYNSISNSDSGVESPPLGAYVDNDVWFSFTMTDTELSLLIQPGSMVNPAVAIYGGDCSDPLLIYNVVDNNCNGSEGPELIFSDLEEGEEYLIRIWSEDGTSNGTFGLFLGTNIPALLSFEVFGDASVMGDCIELTPEEDGQQGCAWYQLEVDFSQPFTHEMIANFGDSNFFGADGICLVYQSNGPDFCGTSGAGIGAEGMPNSAIFEFDTYRNGGPYGDPFGDHTSFNINGNMTHAASIDGPVTTGNLEDGDDHNITFTWNPDGNLYELFLDGELQLSGSFDIINNCFGGESIAYWGYTSSTGSSNNNHIICPLNVEYTPAPVTYEEISICADGEYNGWTEPGFYITEETDVDGCIRQIHTRLEVEEESIPFDLEKYICNGETFEVEGEFFTEEGTYQINTTTATGCDSTINLFLKVIIPTLTINGSQTLDCSTDTILLTIDFDVNYPIADVDFFWLTPMGSSQSDNIVATQPGTYRVNTFINHENVLCQISDQIEIEIDTTQPVLNEIEDLTILCNTPFADQILVAPEDEDSLDYSWYYDNEWIADGDTLQIVGEGTYTLVATDTTNACVDSTTADVIIDGDLPTISIPYDSKTITCDSLFFAIEPEITFLEPGTIEWTFDGDFLTDSPSVLAQQMGIYTIRVTDANGCQAIDSVIINESYIYPEINLVADTIDCGNESATIIADITNGTIESWITPNGNSPTTSTISADEAGTYTLNTINVETGCTTTESIVVVDQTNIPIYNFTENTITCNTPNIELELDINSNYESVLWTFPDGTTSDAVNPTTNQNGIYNLQINVEGSCDLDTIIEIPIDTITSELELELGVLNCANESTFLNIINNESVANFIVLSPSNIIYTELENIVNEPGIYTISVLANNGCVRNQTAEITSLITLPEISITQDSVITCEQPTANIIAISDNNNLSYNWTNNQANSIGTNNSISVTESGIYQLNVTDENGCTNEYSVEVNEELNIPNLSLEASIITCTNPTATATVQSDETLTEILWSNQNEILSTEEIISTTTAGWYYVEATNENGCSRTDSILIQENIDTPELALLSPSTITLTDDNTTETIEIEEITTNNNSYQWSPVEGLSCNDCLEPTIEEYISDQYLLVVTDQNGCTATLNVSVRREQTTEVYIPNIFSPSNEDGQNDKFTVYGNENLELINEMYIYDRWGNLVFSNFDFLPNDPSLGWDGNYKQGDASNGVYIYVIKAITSEGEILSFTGDVTRI